MKRKSAPWVHICTYHVFSHCKRRHLIPRTRRNNFKHYRKLHENWHMSVFSYDRSWTCHVKFWLVYVYAQFMLVIQVTLEGLEPTQLWKDLWHYKKCLLTKQPTQKHTHGDLKVKIHHQALGDPIFETRPFKLSKNWTRLLNSSL